MYLSISKANYMRHILFRTTKIDGWFWVRWFAKFCVRPRRSKSHLYFKAAWSREGKYVSQDTPWWIPAWIWMHRYPEGNFQLGDRGRVSWRRHLNKVVWLKEGVCVEVSWSWGGCGKQRLSLADTAASMKMKDLFYWPCLTSCLQSGIETGLIILLCR